MTTCNISACSRTSRLQAFQAAARRTSCGALPVRHNICEQQQRWQQAQQQQAVAALSAAAHALGPAAAAVCLCLGTTVGPATAAGRTTLPPITESAERCSVSALDKFADTRARFSLEASGGNMVEAVVDVRGRQELHIWVTGCHKI
eukprot:GHRR01015281.1.p1 GENE.GHRR01015281.1~~GHRR01015281.1.p1  ORF type:complete len:146 (+),score=39.91 GHRR01015281.1:162-599(+)